MHFTIFERLTFSRKPKTLYISISLFYEIIVKIDRSQILKEQFLISYLSIDV